MSAIHKPTLYFARSHFQNNPDAELVKPFEKTYNDSVQTYLKDFTDGPLARGSKGVGIFCSEKVDTIYSGSSVITGYCEEGYFNAFNNIQDAVQGKLSRSVNFHCGPFIHGHVIEADIGVKVIGVFNMGLAVLSDLNLVPIKKLPISEFGRPNDSSLSYDDSRMVVANRDHSIYVVDLHKFRVMNTCQMTSVFNPTGVDFGPKYNHTFLTCSRGYSNDDNLVTSWDTRANDPATVVASLDQPANCLRWSRTLDFLATIANIDGTIHFVDTRKKSVDVRSVELVDSPAIFKMKHVGDKLVGFNRTNNLVLIDEAAGTYKIIETGLPKDFILCDMFNYAKSFYALDHRSVHPIKFPINISLD